MAARTPARPSATPNQPHGPEVRGQRHPLDVFPGIHGEERLGPILFVPAWAGVGALVHWWAGSFPGGGVTLAALTFFVAWFLGTWAWHAARARTRMVRLHITVSVWLQVAIIIPWVLYGWSRPWLDIYWYGQFVWAASWVITTFSAVRGYGTDDHGGVGVLEGVLGLERSLTGHVLERSDDGSRVRIRIKHKGTQTKEIQNAAGAVETGLELPHGGFRAEIGDHAAETVVTIVNRDHLRRSSFWPGPFAPGASITELCRVGIYEDGSPMTIVRPGDDEGGFEGKPRQGARIIIGGMPGAGKTEGTLNEAAEIATRKDVLLWWADLDKPWQTIPDIRPIIDWVAVDLETAGAMIKVLPDVISARAEALGRIGKRQWDPQCWTKYGIPYLIAHFEEATSIVNIFEDDLHTTARTCRSAGVSISLSLQRPSHTSMNTDLRAQFSTGMCYGVRDVADSKMVLSEETLDAGARPELWKDTEAGKVYLEAGHRDPRHFAIPGRTFRLPGWWLVQHVAVWAPYMTASDPVTAQAAGPAYANRERVNLTAWRAETMSRYQSEGSRYPGWPGPGELPDRDERLAEWKEAGTTSLLDYDPPTVTDTTTTPTAPPPAAGTATTEGDDDEVNANGTTDVPVFDRARIRDEWASKMTVNEPLPDYFDPDAEPVTPDDAGLADDPISIATPLPDDLARLSRDELAERRRRAFWTVTHRLYTSGTHRVTMNDLTDAFRAVPEGASLSPADTYKRMGQLVDRGFATEVKTAEGRPVTPHTYVLSAAFAEPEPPE